MIEITLDGKKVVVPEGSMVMDAASRLDTYIPHFCYHKKLSIAANCRMCLVDIEKAPKPQPACATPVTSGMVVHTRSEKALKAQRGVMEFLLINHPLDCPICDQGGECLLQDLAVGYGSSASRYTEEKRVVFHKDVGPLVGMEEMSRCIHCTRCVRFGQEIAGVMELGMLNRGEFAEITTFVGQTIDSELSGNMIDICPVGALTSKPFRYSARTWELSRRKSVSPHDGLGSNLMVQVKNERVMRVVPLENEELNECWLSDKDRFSYEGLNSPERLTRPMLKIDGRWREVEWQEALEFVAGALGSVVAEHGASALGALASPHSTLEELYLLQKLVRGLGSENIDTRLRQSDFTLDGRLAGAPWLGMSVAELSQKDSVLVIGSFLRKDHPLLAQRLRQSAKHGAQIASLHSVAADWLMPLSAQSVVAPSAWVRVLAGVAAAVAALKDVPAPIEITPDASAQALAEALLSGAHPAILLGNAAVQHPQAAQLVLLAQWLATQTGAALGILTEAANTVGAYGRGPERAQPDREAAPRLHPAGPRGGTRHRPAARGARSARGGRSRGHADCFSAGQPRWARCAAADCTVHGDLGHVHQCRGARAELQGRGPATRPDAAGLEGAARARQPARAARFRVRHLGRRARRGHGGRRHARGALQQPGAPRSGFRLAAGGRARWRPA
jgi:NADH-quinone oxidoreductase subunit G